MNTIVDNIPFYHRLTNHCLKNLLWSDPGVLSGFCDGKIIDHEGEVFFKLGYDEGTILMIQNEEKILNELSEYYFIPKLLGSNRMGIYYVIFIEKISGVSLDQIKSLDDSRYKLGLIEVSNILGKLYREKKFRHCDIDENNIMVDDNNKVYLIDFSHSTIFQNNTWIKDFCNFIECISLIHIEIDHCIHDRKYYDSTDPLKYQEVLFKLQEIISRF